jgi:hypothetical protein
MPPTCHILSFAYDAVDYSSTRHMSAMDAGAVTACRIIFCCGASVVIGTSRHSLRRNNSVAIGGIADSGKPSKIIRPPHHRW